MAVADTCSSLTAGTLRHSHCEWSGGRSDAAATGTAELIASARCFSCGKLSAHTTGGRWPNLKCRLCRLAIEDVLCFHLSMEIQ
jgi:hypothetical protein